MDTMTVKELEAERDQASAAFKKASQLGYRADLDHAQAYWHRRWVAAVLAEKERTKSDLATHCKQHRRAFDAEMDAARAATARRLNEVL